MPIKKPEMTILLVSILAFAVAAGQLIRIPISRGGITILDITVLLFCLWGIIKSKFHLQKPPSQIMAALVFISIAALSLALTPLRLTLNEYLISFSYTIRFFIYALFAWLASFAFGNFQKNLEKVFLLSGFSFAVLGLLQFIFFPNLNFLVSLGWDPHYFRTVSTFLDPNFAGAFLVLILLIFHLGNGTDKTPRVSYLIFAIIYFALLTTFSRSSYVMFLVSFTVLSVLTKSWRLQVVTIILFFILLSGFFTYTKVVSEPRNIDRIQSASFRLNTWQQGFMLFQSHPILGVGFNSYRYALRQNNLGDAQFLQSHGSSGNDSSLLFIASTTGIIGLLSFLCFLFSLVRSDYSQYSHIVLPATAGLLIHSFFANSLFYPPILLWILLISVNPKK